MKKKIHLGFYMSTPMIGGAERLLRDLLFEIDREQFEVSLFYESWPEFDRFLNLGHCPDIHIHPVPILEPGGHITAASVSESAPSYKVTTIHDRIVKAIAFIKQIHKKYNPVREQTGYILNTLANYLCVGPNLFHLYKALKKQGLDILHIINGGYPGAMSARCATLAAKLAGIPVCIMTVCASPVKQGFPQFIERVLDKLVYKCVDKFIIPADFIGQLLVEYRKFRSSKLYKIPWGVPASESSSTNFALDIKQSLKIPKGLKVIGMAAAFLELKGHRYLIEALSILRKQGFNFQTILVGEGPLRNEIENQVKKAGLSEVISFTGRRSDASEIMKIFDIFVLPSTTEGLPYVVLEAMSQSKPVVATSVGGVPEAVVNGKTGIVVPPRDSLALAVAIERLLINPKLAEEMGKAGFDRYKTNYTIKNMIKQNEILYQKLVSKNQ